VSSESFFADRDNPPEKSMISSRQAGQRPGAGDQNVDRNGDRMADYQTAESMLDTPVCVGKHGAAFSALT